jgi:branched-chain amino acid aminotransferase
MDIGLSPEQMLTRIDEVLTGNGMDTDVHIRLMVTRGIKSTPYQHPKVTITPPTVVIIPEYKVAAEGAGLKLATVHVRRGAPDVQDPALNTHSKLNCIQACIQADKMGADEALMLDPHGFIATCNSTHFFIVRKGEVWTSSGRYCLAGITRANVLALSRGNAIPALEKDFSLTDVYSADEAFVTGTFAGLIPVHEIDGRTISRGTGPVTARLQGLYRDLCEREARA